MLAWVKRASLQYGLVKVEKEIPRISNDQVLVKVLAAGICGTDLGIYKGDRKVVDNLVPGHEFIGEIVKIGKNVEGYKTGDRVVPSIINRCGACWACLNGCEAQCENLQEIGIHIDGSFAEYVAVPKATLHRARPDMDVITGASVEPVAVAYSAVKKVEKLILGKEVLIYGPGPIGHYITQMAKLAGAAKIVVVGTEADAASRLPLAKRNYGVETLNLDAEDADGRLGEFFPKNHGKADVIFEATGAAGAVAGMLPRLAPRGELVLTGIFKEPGEMDLLQIVRGEFSIHGTFCYTLSDFEYALRLVEEGRIIFDGIVETMKLEELGKGFEKEISREAIKVVVTP